MRRIKALTIRLDDVLHKELKLYSVETEESIQSIITRLVQEELEKAGKLEKKKEE